MKKFRQKLLDFPVILALFVAEDQIVYTVLTGKFQQFIPVEIRYIIADGVPAAAALYRKDVVIIGRNFFRNSFCHVNITDNHRWNIPKSQFPQ